MRSKDGWIEIAALPNERYGDSPLSTIITVAHALGYDMAEVELADCYVDDERWLSLRVPEHAERRDWVVGVTIEDGLGLGPLVEQRALPPGPPALPPRQEEQAPAEQAPAAEEPLPPRTARCEDCGGLFDSVRGLGRHRAVKHGPVDPDAPLEYVCGDCSRSFDSNHGLSVHQAMQHKEDTGPLSYWRKGDPMLGCRECPWYTNSVVTMAVHTNKVHDREPSVPERTPLGGAAVLQRLEAATADVRGDERVREDLDRRGSGGGDA